MMHAHAWNFQKTDDGSLFACAHFGRLAVMLSLKVDRRVTLMFALDPPEPVQPTLFDVASITKPSPQVDPNEATPEEITDVRNVVLRDHTKNHHGLIENLPVYLAGCPMCEEELRGTK